MQFKLTRNERLKSRKLIDQLFSEGVSFSLHPFRVLYMVHPRGSVGPQSNLQFGVGVSARHFKKAVDRNRVKRLTREAYRLQKQELQAQAKLKGKILYVFFIYTGKELPDYHFLKEKLGIALQKLVTITNETDPSNT
ncbi:MAG: ribonuclease P protein component [Terrimonas sp.]|nr:ribonuclease P protein component [Terrimonas sp.]